MHGDVVAGSVANGELIGFKPSFASAVNIGIKIKRFGLTQLEDNSTLNEPPLP